MLTRVLLCGLLIFGVEGCTAEQRKAAQDAAAEYVGAPVDSTVPEILVEAGKDIAEKGGNAGEIILYVVGGAIAIVGGIFGKRAVVKKFTAPKE
jgi:hypothetical protein